MDDQHGILMDAMNDLRLAVVHGNPREQISELLDRLIEFTRMHFTSEERLLEKSGFPGLAGHRAQHHKILAEILQSAHRLQYSSEIDLVSLLAFLKNDYTEHLQGVDQQYGEWLNHSGIF
jgi:hemerythrin-like metal-binding protein